MSRIGILAGLGAAAGVRFYDLLVRECQRRGAVLDSDFPEIVIYNMSSEGMDARGVVNILRMREDLLKGIMLLNKCGVKRIVIACNSVHIFHNELQKHSSAYILNMPEIAKEYCRGKKVGVISSRSTRDTTLYGFGTLFCDDLQQVRVDTIIGRVVSGRSDSRDHTQLRTITRTLFKRGAYYVVLACTELPILMNPSRNVIDPAELVIRKLLDEYDSERN